MDSAGNEEVKGDTGEEGKEETGGEAVVEETSSVKPVDAPSEDLDKSEDIPSKDEEEESNPAEVLLVDEGEPPEGVVLDEVVVLDDEPSVIEMEVDDSNTGDTMTSNPEIDSGCAAVAATAVIDDEARLSLEVGKIVIVSTASAPATQTPSSIVVSIAPTAVAAKVTSSSVSLTGNKQATQLGNKPDKGPSSPCPVDDDKEPSPPSISSSVAPAAVTILADSAESSTDNETDGLRSSSSSEIAAAPGRKKILEVDLSEPMDTSESDTPSISGQGDGDEICEPTAVLLESISATEMEQDMLMEPMRRTDMMFDREGQHYLHDEDSMSSMPDDTTDLDKENHGGDRDLIIGDDDNEDDDDTYLEITRRRISQDREGNCYCGKDRNFNIPELLCVSCNRWFHESCISYQLGKLVPFTTNYVFTCKNCSPTGLECFRRNQAQFSQMCETVLANLAQASAKEGTNMKLFSKDRDIIPFFEIHWEALTTTTRRVTQSWHSTVIKTLVKEAGLMYVHKEVPGDEFSPYFGLLCDDLSLIRPNYDAMIRSGQLKIADSRNSSSSMRGRGAKRRTIPDQPNGMQNAMNKKPRGDTFGPKPVIGHGYPTEHPFNKDSYRYILAEPDPNAPFRQEFDESNEWSGKPIHGWLCRVVNPPSVLLALHDRAPQLRVSEDRLSVTGEKGYCMIRATHGVNKGSWYFEAKITDMPEGSATRLGFSQQFANLQGPLGFDRYGYSWRSRYGTAFHEARGKSYAKGGYGLDDVLGFLIVLPEDKNLPTVAASMKDRPLVKVKSHLYYEDKDDTKELTKRDLRKGSKILCFKNGVCQGVAFDNIFCGTYYPAISLYKSITVRVNFGPDFEAPPETDLDFRPMSDRAEDSVMENTVADLVYLTENEGNLRLDNAVPMPL